jgi:hypothetical protein
MQSVTGAVDCTVKYLFGTEYREKNNGAGTEERNSGKTILCEMWSI